MYTLTNICVCVCTHTMSYCFVLCTLDLIIFPGFIYFTWNRALNGVYVDRKGKNSNANYGFYEKTKTVYFKRFKKNFVCTLLENIFGKKKLLYKYKKK